jgi:prepilin-type processing-associated H-X9-DG protein
VGQQQQQPVSGDGEHRQRAPNAVFAVGGPAIGIAAITNGTSNTIAYGEWRMGSGNINTITPPVDIVMIGSLPRGVTRNTPTVNMPINMTNFRTWLTQCATSIRTSRGNRKTVSLGEAWSIGLPSYALGNVLQAPNPGFPNCNASTASGNAVNQPGMYGLSSRHPSGANVLMCDGSVKFLKDSTNMVTVWALGSRNQGEILSADAY